MNKQSPKGKRLASIYNNHANLRDEGARDNPEKAKLSFLMTHSKWIDKNVKDKEIAKDIISIASDIGVAGYEQGYQKALEDIKKTKIIVANP